MQDNTVTIDTSQSPAALTFAPVFNVAAPFIDRHIAEAARTKWRSAPPMATSPTASWRPT